MIDLGTAVCSGAFVAIAGVGAVFVNAAGIGGGLNDGGGGAGGSVDGVICGGFDVTASWATLVAGISTFTSGGGAFGVGVSTTGVWAV